MTSNGEGFLRKAWRSLFGWRPGVTESKPPLDIEIVDPFERFERAILEDSECGEE